MLSNLGSTAGRAVLVGILVLAGVLMAPASSADAAEGTPGKLMLVLDSSGSMKEKVPGGQTKIAAAKEALHQVVKQLPADQPVGLRVFGAKVFSRGDAGACQDSQLRVPVGTGNQAQLNAAIDTYKPYGETPIGYALQEAAKDLGSEGQRSIVLVSDGKPTCEPNPCEVARQLTKQGIDLKIDVVGLDVDASTRETLQCIADNGHGTYYDVDNAGDFASSLIKVTTRAARGFTVIGTPVTGSASAADAPTISDGDWQDVTPVGEAGQEKVLTYRVERRLANSWLAVSAAFRDPESTVLTSLSLAAPDGSSCGSDGSVQQLAGYQLTTTAVQATLFNSIGRETPDSACLTSDHLIATMKIDRSATAGTPIELRVVETPEATNLSALPEPYAGDVSWVSPSAGQRTPVQGGTSFADAPELTPGGYTDSIVQGETLTYQVAVDWGQQLSVQAVMPRLDKDRIREAVAGTPIVNLRVYSPGRVDATGYNLKGHHQSQAAYFAFDGPVLSTATAPVRVRNAARDTGGVSAADQAGLYTVVVFLAKTPKGASIPIPFKLDIGVSGTVEGAPTYAEDTPATASAEATDGAGDPRADLSDKPSTTPDSRAAGKDDGGGFPVGIVLGGLGVLAIVGAGVVYLRSRARA